ncbi:sodium:solute symporter [Gulosibacter sp. 10]|uniref:sodium:solute symporter family protein n=1 Tax=Gulosibacter sp. 10 TaxID=1255570 RepID=UPI00097ED672|nr:sodium:solute symporter family protein [Gulosibacter sp. 10]SJM66370.1 Na+/solute symporter [Gulosibacter sp. 10]
MFTIAVIGSFVLYLIVGAVVGRTIKTTDDYYVSGRNAPTFLVAGTLVASFISTVTFMGELGFSYDGFPFPLLLLVSFNISGYAVGVLFFGRYLRRSEALTVPEYFGKRFDSKAVQAVAGAMVVIGIGLYLVSVSHGLALILAELIDLPMWAILIIVWACYTVFTMISGARGVLINDTIMYVLFTIAAVVGMGVVIGYAGGPVEAVEKLTNFVSKPDGLAWHGLTGSESSFAAPSDALIYSLTFGISWAVVVAVSPWQSSRYLMAKNEHVALRSGLFATASLLVMYLFIAFGGFAINLINPNIDPSEVAFIWIGQNFLPPAIGIIIITGIVAAALSSAASFLSIIGFSAANDILPVISKRFRARTHVTTMTGSINTQAVTTEPENAATADKAKLQASRIVMLLISVVVLGLTFVTPPVVLAIGYFAATLFAAAWGPVAIWSTQSRKITARGALAGMITGFTVSVGLQGLTEFTPLTLPTILDPVLLGMVLGIIAIYLGDRGRKPSEKSLAYFDRIQAVPKEERNPRLVRGTGIMAWSVVGICAAAIIAMILLYAIPYGNIVG